MENINYHQEAMKAFGQLLQILDELREKCPWDQKQTWQSLSHLTIEETYELYDALLQNNVTDVKKELGDVLLHLIFYAKIASEKSQFTIYDVITSLNQKLIDRHPHIYGDKVLETEEEVLKNWELQKLKQGNESVLSGVPKALPAMVKAMRVQEKASGVGFDWKNPLDAFNKVEEELAEFKQELQQNQHEKMHDEFGDLLFSLINVARLMNINPEEALARTNLKFISRFQQMETLMKTDNKAFEQMDLPEMDHYWERAKLILKKD